MRVHFCFQKNVTGVWGSIEHVVATVTEGNKSLIFVKAGGGASVESDQKIVPMVGKEKEKIISRETGDSSKFTASACRLSTRKSLQAVLAGPRANWKWTGPH